MAWSYNENLATDNPPTKDLYRYLIGDIIEKDPILQDGDIETGMRVNNNDKNKVMSQLLSLALQVYSAKIGNTAITRSIGTLSETLSNADQRLKILQNLADKYVISDVNTSGVAYGFGSYNK